jgi:hypothetical protein
MALASLVPFQGPKKSRFSGPTPSNAPRNAVALLKTITYRAIKTTGTLIVNIRTVTFTILYIYVSSADIVQRLKRTLFVELQHSFQLILF